MSRILRRPMFRGGRVDSRGTGITSGLGYEKGGSVNIPKRGLVDGPGGYAGEIGSLEGYSGPVRISQSMIGNLPSWFDINRYPVIYKNYDDSGQYYIQRGGFGEKGTGAPMREVDAKQYPMFKFNNNPFSSEYGQPNEVGQDIRAYNRTKDMIDKQMALSGESSRTFNEPELPEEKTEEKSLEEIMKEMMGTKKSPKEKVKEYKEIFKDAYGSGVADDASAMALSFAKNALAPDATVKSAFAGFFDDESKRPSQRKKYSDAATTAAINAYLTGEKDYDSLMKQMKIIDYQIDKKAEAAKASETLDVLLETYAGNSGDRTDAGVMQAAFNRLYKDKEGYAGFIGPLPENKEDLIVGGIYYANDPNDTRTKIIYEIDASGTPQKIRSIMK